MPEEDDDEYFFLGTPLQEEEESHAGQRRKVVQDPSTVKQLPLWKQVRQCDAKVHQQACVLLGSTILLQSPLVLLHKSPVTTVTSPLACLYLQEVTDEEGRRRFHGAFTGGFSAGYYNTVGSLEGWEPKAFQSSRGDRGAARCSDAWLQAMLTFILPGCRAL